MNRESFSLVLFLFLCIIFVFFLSAPVHAAYAEISTPYEGYAGGTTLHVEGAAEPDVGSKFRRWILELGTENDAGEFVLIRELKRGTSRIGNSDNDIDTDDYGVLLDAGDISDLTNEKEYALKLTVVDYVASSGKESQYSTITHFTKMPRSFTFKLIHDGGKSFSQIGIELQGKDKSGEDDGEDFINWEDSSLPQGIVCKASCILRLDNSISDENLFYDPEVDVNIVAEDTSGKFFVFYKKYDSSSVLEFKTASTKKVNDLSVIKLFAQKSIPLISTSLVVFDDSYGPTNGGVPSVYTASDTGLLFMPYIDLKYFGQSTSHQLMRLHALFTPPWNDFTEAPDLQSQDLFVHGTIKDDDGVYDGSMYDFIDTGGDYALRSDTDIFTLVPETKYSLITQTHVRNYVISNVITSEAVSADSKTTSRSLLEESYFPGNIEFFKDPFFLSLGLGSDRRDIVGNLKDATEGVFSGFNPGSVSSIKISDGSSFDRKTFLPWYFSECEAGNCKIGNVYHVDWSLEGAFIDGRTLRTSDDFTFIGDQFVQGKLKTFIRGNANDDARVDLSDAIFILDYLFKDGGKVPSCMDAADVNDDGTIDIADPIALLFVLFQGKEMKAPFPEEGYDLTSDELGCAV